MLLKNEHKIATFYMVALILHVLQKSLTTHVVIL
jgi:hypothetical protein